MDPNQALADLRAAIAGFPNAVNDEGRMFRATEAMYAAESLDMWLTKGGFPPQDWRVGKTGVLR